MRFYPRHLWTFVTLNAAATAVNFLTGQPWWAFWLLIVTSFLLGVHYLLYKALTVDEQWAEERTEELNLKSYDRSHIEELKGRFGRMRDHKR